MNQNKNLLWIGSILLLVVDALTFHDMTEVHTVRDWLTLVASIFVFIYFFNVYKKSKQ